jgi:PAS domain S-box-containing protein
VRSLEKQLPLAAFVLLTLVAGSLTIAAYRDARFQARALFSERLIRLSDQLAGSIGASVVRARTAVTETAQHPTFARVLTSPTREDADSAAAILARMIPGAPAAIVSGVWDLAGDLVVPGPGARTADWVPRPPLVEEPTVTRVVAENDTLVHYGIVAPIRAGRVLVGFLQLRQRLSAGAATAAVETVLGPSGRILLGSPEGAWTDLAARADSPPPEVVGAEMAIEYERDGQRRFGLGRSLAGTSVAVVTEVAESAVLASTRSFLGRVGAVAALLVAVATGAAWLLGRRITGPLAQLRIAAERLGSGDYGQRVAEAGHSETVKVARTFNKMASETEGHVTALRSSEQRFRSLVTATAQIVWWTDAEGNVTEPLPSWQSYTGRSFDETRGAGWTAALHPDDAANALHVWKEAVAKRSLFETEYRIRRHDGEYRWFIVRAVPIVERDGRIREWVATCTDITGRRDAEDRLRSKELELQRSQRLDAVGRLAGGIAHDFNNLLSAILGPAELAADELPKGHPVLDDLRDIRNAALRASALTRKLLAFGRQQVMMPVVLDVNEEVESASQLLRRLIGEGIQLETSLRASRPMIRVDRTQLEQIIVNLAVNARDAMPDGGRLTIETGDIRVDRAMADEHRGLRPGEYVLLAVTDTGVGMDAATQRQIFEPFFTTKEHDKGTGLGLSTVYGIVRQSGGHIWVYSEPGKGTSFKIHFPCVRSGVADIVPAPEEKETPRGTETILLAEDEEEVRRLAVRILARLGYTVLPAQNGREALALAASHGGEIHLLLSDVVMPEMNGVELWERLRVERPGVPALFLSGWASDAVVRHGILDGQLPFLQKPFSPHQLGVMLREVLAGARATDGHEAAGAGT